MSSRQEMRSPHAAAPKAQLSVLHETIEIARKFPVPPQEVFAAFSDAQAKARWSGCHANARHHLDFRVGGAETMHMPSPEGLYAMEAHYYDIVPAARIVYSYTLRLERTEKTVPMSAGLVTVLFEPSGKGTRLRYFEQLAFLDGHHDPAERRRGTEEGLQRLELEVMRKGRAQ